MHIYYPSDKFPSLSITGKFCALKCKHCNGKYLQHMIPVETPKKLLDFVLMHEKNINGFLLSGGSTTEGKVPLKKFKDAVKWIRENTNLLINIHTGIIYENDLPYLEEMNPHQISFDVIGSSSVIHKVIGIKKNKENYFDALNLLDSSTLNYSPHIIIGLDYGKIGWEYPTIDYISHLKRFSNLVLIVLIPTPGTPMENVKLNEDDVLKVIEYASKKIDRNKIVIGCMRPRNMHRIERLAVDLNLKGLVMPSPKTIKYMVEKNIHYDIKETCCVF